jgi:hypothetical protein
MKQPSPRVSEGSSTGVLAHEGVHRSAGTGQFRIRHERIEEHLLLPLVMEVAGELGENAANRLPSSGSAVPLTSASTYARNDPST